MSDVFKSELSSSAITIDFVDKLSGSLEGGIHRFPAKFSEGRDGVVPERSRRDGVNTSEESRILRDGQISSLPCRPLNPVSVAVPTSTVAAPALGFRSLSLLYFGLREVKPRINPRFPPLHDFCKGTAV